ncbi:lipoyl domain-containing protein [Salinigranum salinum]|uniref:lipoyl domain-containing protein n=1 Tax=Salinigranum salinum TaxID=1364937 RepID=UPI0012604958|nr:lipoyl domain-containing protein [Salinigranum salinum]
MSGDEKASAGDDDRVPIETGAVWPADAADVEEGYVVNWFAREGRSLDAGETVCEIQIEKVSVDVPTPVAGTLVDIVVAEGDVCGQNETLGWIQPG